MWGTDQSTSLELNGMSVIGEMLPKINKILGDGKKKFLKDEKIKFLSQNIGNTLIKYLTIIQLEKIQKG